MKKTQENHSGNFRQMVNLVDNYSAIMQKWIAEIGERSYQVTYLSNLSQMNLFIYSQEMEHLN